MTPDREPRQQTAADAAPQEAEFTDQESIHQIHSQVLRENAEPHDGLEPVPLWMSLLFGGLLFWGGFYLSTYSGRFLKDAYDLGPTMMSGGSPPPASKPLDPKVLGQRIYANCAACHQPTGAGVPGQFPPLAGSEWVVDKPTAQLIRILLQGMTGPVMVKGAVYNSNMPAWGAILKDAQIAAVLTHIRSEWGNKADPISEEMVAAVRRETAGRSTPWTAAELEQFTDGPSPPAKKE